MLSENAGMDAPASCGNRLKRRRFVASSAHALGPVVLVRSDPMALVVPFPPVVAMDATSRAVAVAAARGLKASTVVGRNPGPSVSIAAEAVSRSTSPTTFLPGTTAEQPAMKSTLPARGQAACRDGGALARGVHRKLSVNRRRGAGLNITVD